MVYLFLYLTIKTNKAMKKILNINGQLIEARLFKTRQAADNFISKKIGREVLYGRAHEYYVSI